MSSNNSTPNTKFNTKHVVDSDFQTFLEFYTVKKSANFVKEYALLILKLDTHTQIYILNKAKTNSLIPSLQIVSY